eukprot:scaffold5182_cov376-Prasinococcus_capsulatus_cf.AAC.6
MRVLACEALRELSVWPASSSTCYLHVAQLNNWTRGAPEIWARPRPGDAAPICPLCYTTTLVIRRTTHSWKRPPTQSRELQSATSLCAQAAHAPGT